MPAAYRADQVGSLLRPPELLAARAAHAEGRLGADALREREDRAILEALALQRRAGLDVVTDGEYRRASFIADMAEAVEGFVDDRVIFEWRGPGGRAEEAKAQGPSGFVIKHVPLENLALSPQRGFASVAAGNLLSPDEQRRKLELVADTARKVWR
jgi:5-methyltetrahydropteroyltriglutamate--homocysteine methyltransferase